MPEYNVYFQRDVPFMKVNGTLAHVREKVSKVVSKPVVDVHGHRVLISGASIWPAIKGTAYHTDKAVGTYKVGVFKGYEGKDYRIAMWFPMNPDETAYFIGKNGKLIEKIDYWEAMDAYNLELKTRGKRVKTM